MDWIRAKDLSEIYPISQNHGYILAREFRAQGDPRDVIKDGRMLILRQSAFEAWWRNRDANGRN